MPQIINFMKTCRFLKYTILVLVSFTTVAEAQLSIVNTVKNRPFSKFLVTENVDTVCISFGEKLNNIREIDSLVTWEVRNKDTDEIIETGSGQSLLDIVFIDPGNFLIHFNHHREYNPSSCDHKSLPDLIDLMVSPVRMVYKCDQIVFSSPITAGVPTDGIILTVNVEVALSGIAEYSFSVPQVRTSGTDTEIIATPLQSPLLITSGMHQLQYVLSGKVDRPSYVIFDFIDANSKIQDYTYTLLVN